MPHPVFGIDELLRLVINELVEASPPAAVSFALTCRSFEEPTLCSLWRRQPSLVDLVKVLPNHTWVKNRYSFVTIAVEDDPSAKDWFRLRRYAAWMRKLYLRPDQDPTVDTLQRLSNNSPGGILCPRLEQLHWDACGTDSALLFIRLFLSPRLKGVTLYTYPIPTQSGLSTAVAQVISLLPISLEEVSIEPGYEGDEALADAVSSFICRCGPSLRSFSTCMPLSEVATRHVVQLPNLRSWTVTNGPPRAVPASILPSLEQLHLDKPEALPWLHLLASRQKGIVQDRSASVARTRESLKSITCPRSTVVDSTLLSSFITFQNLATLRVQAHCPRAEGCMFRLTDDDMENLATALPRLEILELGRPCSYNSCNNTVASLLSISIHCLDLTVLETHFNARTIVGDMQRLFDRGTGSDGAKCKLSRLMVFLPFEVRGEDIGAVMVGFKVIFPCLEAVGYDGYWHELSSELGD